MMQSCVPVPIVQGEAESPLLYLPFSALVDYPKGFRIFTSDQWCTALFLVVKGSIKLSRLASNGRQVVVDIYGSEDLLGESCFLSRPHHEEAMALENTKVMSWTFPVLMESILRRPPLAVALLQLLTQRNIEFKERIESFSTDKVPRRLARALCRFSDRLGAPDGNGAVRVAPFTHELLAQYIGTTREAVTHCMNRFRRQGYLKYSRKAITLQTEALRHWLTQQD